MLIAREDLRFDFKGAQFDLAAAEDRAFLGWVFNQFLYGEVTGIQCGYWLYRAPHLNAAAFLARQAAEELSHVKRILRILSLLGEAPASAHPAIRFLSTGMMGGSWGEHVTMEMALGEGLVLTIFYAMAETIPSEEIKKILESAITEEESHVRFGERETQEWLERYPSDRDFFLAQAILQSIAMRKLKGFVLRKLAGREHSVLRQFSEFYDHVIERFEARVVLLGVSDRPLGDLSWFTRVTALLRIPYYKLRSRFFRQRDLLTQTYLGDRVVRAETSRN